MYRKVPCGRSARNVNNQNYLAVQYFSANDILLRLCKAKMKIYKRSLQGLLSFTPYSFAARSDLCSLAAHFTRHTWRVLIFNTQINVIP